MRRIGVIVALLLLPLLAAQQLYVPPFTLPATTCTNQFVRSIAAATGVGTCATVGTSDLASSLSLVTPNINVATATTINGAALDNLAWSTYVPVATCGAGTITTQTISGRYKTIGKTIKLQISLLITTVGTCTGAITITVPVAINATGQYYAMATYDLAGTTFPTIAASGNSGVVLIITPTSAHTYIITGTYEST